MIENFDLALLNDLRGQVRGELLLDSVPRSLYSHDASILAVRPLGVFAPADEEDVKIVARWAAETRLPLHARGAGTGMAGESLGPGLVLDFSRYLDRIIETNVDSVRVQPGVVLQRLNQHLAKMGRRIGPDPASAAACTIGGMIATNASGPRAIKYGYMRDYVLRLQTVLADGEEVEFAVPGNANYFASERVDRLATQVGDLLRENSELITACQPRTRFNRLGYLLHDVVTPQWVDLARLLVGSEGTLGLVTEATLRTVPIPAERCCALLGFASLELAARSIGLILAAEPSALELLDRRSLVLACEAEPRLDRLITPGVQALLLAEFEGDSPGQARRIASAAISAIMPMQRRGLTLSQIANNAEESDWMWRIRELAAERIHSIRGPARPVAYLEDVAVPHEALPEFLVKIQDVLQHHQATASLLIHAATGQVHLRPFLDLSRSEEVVCLRRIADAVHRLALDFGGTISSQHGTGLVRTPWIELQYGRLAKVFQQLKDIFDPEGILNPGKIVAREAGDPLAWLRAQATTRQEPIPLQLIWPPRGVEEAANLCNGCGSCRTEDETFRMCPMFRAESQEAASPRAKATLLRELFASERALNQWASDEIRAVADLCVNCKMCGLECPSKVPIPKLMLETKAQHLAENGWKWGDWVLARTESFAAFGSNFSWLTNQMLASRSVRWLLSKLLGIAPQRQLPRFAGVSFLRQAQRRGWTRLPRRKVQQRVAYFVDIYANYIDPTIAHATVAVLHHHGIEVFVPPGQTGCGMAPLAYGDMDTAHRMARRNLDHLADLARAGFRIICSEPTAALMLRQDYLDLIGDHDARMVAEQTTELTSFLAELCGKGRLRGGLKPLRLQVGHHVPCHLKALQLGLHGPSLLARIPELEVEVLDVSCSGMAGTFGFKESGFESSLAAGRPMLKRFRDDALHSGSTECSACRLQMEHAGRKTTLHPVQYLALSYGLMPELAGQLTPMSNGKGYDGD